MHGGATPWGAAHYRYKHGRRSKFFRRSPPAYVQLGGTCFALDAITAVQFHQDPQTRKSWAVVRFRSASTCIVLDPEEAEKLVAYLRGTTTHL
jgi:hypothetical protein